MTRRNAASGTVRGGCLLLHGLTSSVATVDGLVPHLVARGIPYRLPVLRGHGGAPGDLAGVTWRDWYADARAALEDLLHECDRAVVVGLSMGGVVALHLAAERNEQICGVVAIAPALRLVGTPVEQARLACLALAGRQMSANPLNAYQDPELAARSTNYPTAPARAILSLVGYGRKVARLVPHVRAPLLVLYSPNDRIADPRAARSLFARAGTPAPRKQLVAFPNSGHEMLLDREAPSVIAAVMRFVDGRVLPSVAPSQEER